MYRFLSLQEMIGTFSHKYRQTIHVELESPDTVEDTCGWEFVRTEMNLKKSFVLDL